MATGLPHPLMAICFNSSEKSEANHTIKFPACSRFFRAIVYREKKINKQSEKNKQNNSLLFYCGKECLLNLRFDLLLISFR